MNTPIGRTVTVLDYNPLTGEFTARESAYDGPVSDKAWRGINALFLDEQVAGKFYPDNPADVLHHAVQAAESAAEKIAAGMPLRDGVSADTYVIAAAKLAMLNYTERKVLPQREEHAAVEDGRICELRVRAPLHVRAEYALNFLSELCERILATDRKLGETIVLAFDEKAKKRILKVIASGGPKGVTRNELTRKTQFIRRSMRDEYLEDLVDAGEIVIKEFSDGRSHGETLILGEFAHHE